MGQVLEDEIQAQDMLVLHLVDLMEAEVQVVEVLVQDILSRQEEKALVDVVLVRLLHALHGQALQSINLLENEDNIKGFSVKREAFLLY